MLTVEQTGIDVRIIDESAMGLLIEAEEVVPAKRDDIVILRTYSDRYQVRIAYVRRRGERTRIGIQRLRELPDLEEASEKQPALERGIGFYVWHFVRPILPVVLLVFGGATAVFCLASVLATSRHGATNPEGGPFGPGAHELSHTAKDQPGQSVHERGKQKLRAAKRRLLNRFVARPELAAALGLSDEQQQEIARIVQSKLQPQPGDSGSDSPQVDDGVVDQAFDEVAATLTPKQRKKLLALRLE